MALPALPSLGPFTLPLTEQTGLSQVWGFVPWAKPSMAETIPETVFRLFISSPFILIPQNYLVTIQGEGH